MEEQVQKPKNRSRRDKLQDALEAIYKSESKANTQEKLQAVKLAAELEMSKPKIQRKTDKEKAQIAALKTITPKKKADPKASQSSS